MPLTRHMTQPRVSLSSSVASIAQIQGRCLGSKTLPRLCSEVLPTGMGFAIVLVVNEWRGECLGDGSW